MALAHAILAALNDRPCSGYDLAKQIYRELSKLEEKGYLASETVRQEGRPDKKLYQVTQTGKAFLQDWIVQPCDVTPIKDDLLVKLFAGYLVPKAAIVAELEQHHRQHSDTLSTYRQIETKFFSESETLSAENRFRYLTLQNGIRYETAWLSWCEEAIAFLNAAEPSSD
jgi:DNA-binding PadR family transcriptional regulator